MEGLLVIEKNSDKLKVSCLRLMVSAQLTILKKERKKINFLSVLHSLELAATLVQK